MSIDILRRLGIFVVLVLVQGLVFNHIHLLYIVQHIYSFFMYIDQHKTTSFRRMPCAFPCRLLTHI